MESLRVFPVIFSIISNLHSLVHSYGYNMAPHYQPYPAYGGYSAHYGQVYTQSGAYQPYTYSVLNEVSSGTVTGKKKINIKPNSNQHKKHVKKQESSFLFIPPREIIEIQSKSSEVETAPELLEGDIAIPEGKSRLAVDFDRFPAKKWKNNTVPYRISINHTASQVLIIESALRTMAFVSCVKFEKWDGKKKDYIHFQPDKKRKGCWSYIGHQGGRQQLSLERPVGDDCNCFCSPGRAMHEIMHALGFYHEHARADRDKYVQIVKKNVRRGKYANFFTKSDDETSRNFDYDYKSIMHYGPYFFSKNKRGKKATIIPKKPGAAIGQRDMLSRMDCMKINSLYKCFDGNSQHVRKIQMICALVGI